MGKKELKKMHQRRKKKIKIIALTEKKKQNKIAQFNEQ
jgi:hypothetical protein